MNKDTTNPKDLIGKSKPSMSLVPTAGIIHEALAMGDGARKYGAYNWRDKKVQSLVYIDAALRHLRSWVDGEEVAADSGVHHIGHARACLGILLDAQECGQLVDDRPAKGPAAAMIARLTKTKPDVVIEGAPALTPEGEDL